MQTPAYADRYTWRMWMPPNGPGAQLPARLARGLERRVSKPNTTTGRLKRDGAGQLQRLVGRRARMTR
jgi:hypothetical protein